MHPGAFRWDLEKNIADITTVEGQMFSILNKLENIRKNEKAFVSYADTWMIETYDPGVLCIGRYYDGEKILGIFNFTENDRTAWINEDGEYENLLTGHRCKAAGVDVPAYGFFYLKEVTK